MKNETITKPLTGLTKPLTGFAELLRQQQNQEEQKNKTQKTKNSIENSIADAFASPQEKLLRVFFNEILKR